MSTIAYAVIICRAWMNEAGYGFHYTMPSGRLGSHAAAVREGLRAAESDDFNIGKFQDGRLVDLLWMNESVGEPPDVLAEVARAIGVKA